MEVLKKNPPRKFMVGKPDAPIEISDCGEIKLEPDELVTFIKPSGSRFDFSCKDWGYYVTPSMNSRLRNEGFKVALVKNTVDRYFVMAVEEAQMSLFLKYAKDEEQQIVAWLDDWGTK